MNFDTTLLRKKVVYLFRGRRLTYSHATENKRGDKCFVFITEAGKIKEISQALVKKELWEEVNYPTVNICNLEAFQGE